jgi:hypothetical protein
MRIAAAISAAALLTALTALGGCEGPGSVQDAGAKIAAFHRQLDAGDYEAIWRDSGPDMQTDKAKAGALFAAVHAKLGKVRDSKQTGWRSEASTGGSFVEVTMQTRFERGTGEEVFLYKGKGAEQRLAGYNINSADMMLK